MVKVPKMIQEKEKKKKVKREGSIYMEEMGG